MSPSFATPPVSIHPPAPWSQVHAELTHRAVEFAGEATLESLADHALRLLVASVSAHRASLSLLDPLTGFLKIAAAIGSPGTKAGQNVTRPRSVSEWVLRNGRGLVLQGRVRTTQIEGNGDERLQSSMCVPLTGERGTIGVLSLARGAALPPFVDEELPQAAAALIPLSVALVRRLETERAQRAVTAIDAAASSVQAPWRSRVLVARNVECVATCRTSWEHGSSFTACAPLRNGSQALLAADVGCRGVAGLELARFLEGVFQAAAERACELEDLALQLDRAWHAHFGNQSPCAIWLARPAGAGLIESCSLGADSLHLVPSGDGQIQFAALAQPALGMTRDANPQIWRHRLLPGDTLLFTTAPVVEIADAGGELFGFNRLHELLGELRSRSLDQLVSSVCDRALAHAGRSWWRSDLLVAAIRARRED